MTLENMFQLYAVIGLLIGGTMTAVRLAKREPRGIRESLLFALTVVAVTTAWPLALMLLIFDKN